MAIAQEGSLQKSSSAADPLAWNVTIPAGANCVVFASGYYDGANDDLVSVDIGGTQSFTVDFNASGSTGYDMASMAHIVRNDLSTGAVTINVDWDSTRDYVGQHYLLFLSGVQTGNPRDVKSQQSSSPSLSFTTEPDDWVVCIAALDMSPTWTNCTGLASDVVALYASIARLIADGSSETIAVTAASTAWGGIVLIPAGAGGTQYERSVSGALTFAGVAARQPGKLVVGGVSFAGQSAKQARKRTAGALASSAKLIRRTARTVTGALTFAGSVGSIKFLTRLFTGSLSLAGTLARLPRKSFAGALTWSGRIARATRRTLAGAVAFAASHVGNKLAGTYTAMLSGGLALAGTVSRLPRKSLAGATAFAGALARRGRIGLKGAVASAGALGRRIPVRLAAAAAFVGSLDVLKTAGLFFQSLSGALMAAGTLSRLPRKSLAGAVQFTTKMPRAIRFRLAGAVGFAAQTFKRTATRLDPGTLPSSGAVFKRTRRTLAGVLNFLGSVAGHVNVLILVADAYRLYVVGPRYLVVARECRYALAAAGPRYRMTDRC